MTCTPFRAESGASGFVCTDRRSKPRCRACGKPAPLLCDWKVPTRKSGTCDAPICANCSTSPAPDKDLCPTHAQAWSVWHPRKSAAEETPAAR